MRRALLPVLLLLGGGAAAQAPEEAPIPPPRPAPEAPARPEARPDGRPPGPAAEAPSAESVGGQAARLPVIPPTRPGEALVIAVESEGGPHVLVVPSVIAPPPPVPAITGPLPEGRAPGMARLPPLLRGAGEEDPAAVLPGPRQVVRAEALMTEPPPVPVIVGGWDADLPPVRPGTEPPPAVTSGAPLRPRPRPLPPTDPVALVPPEPDAPPAYSPGARPDVLPLSPEFSALAVATALLPALRPEGVVERAEAARAALARGQVCGDPRIQGEVAAAIRGGGGCGIEEPVRIRSIDGVRLSEAALMDCATAQALLEWVREGARPALGGRGGGLVGLQVMGHYSCRPRNNQAGARLSEHGRGRAIDIGAVILADGSRLTVARDWPDPDLREMHEAACGIFSTTLGPGSDGFHEDHFHYDTARGRGPYCR